MENKHKKGYSRILIKEFVKAEYTTRYQDSVIGYAWAFLKPFFLFLIIWIVFTKFLNLGKGIPYWSASLMCGTVFWTFFVETTTTTLRSIRWQSGLIKKINFPKYVIVISSSLIALINMLINFVAVFIFAALLHVPFNLSIFLLLLLILEIYMFATGLGFFLSTTFIYFRDIDNIWEIILQAYMYVSVIMYPIATVKEHSETIAKFALLNPMAQIVQDMRHLISHTDTVWSLWSNNFIISLIPVLLVFVIFVWGIAFFQKKQKMFAEDC